MLKQGFAVLLLTLLVGCGSDAPFEYIPVQGQLTYEDGSTIPAGGIRLQFIPIEIDLESDAQPRTASTGLDSKGNFKNVTSYKYGDGLMPGKHKVAIFYAKDKSGKLLVPKDYTHASTTPLIIETSDSPFEIKVPKP